MVSAPGQNLRDIRYISALCEAPLRVTAELNEMVQYVEQDDAVLCGRLILCSKNHARVILTSE